MGFFKAKPHICPVCRKYEFRDANSFDTCPVCGWVDDEYQLLFPDAEGDGNEICLLDAKDSYRKYGKII
mgnify:CR=1 FL=1